MEMVARITVVTGRSLGSIVRGYGRWLPGTLLFCVVFGCAAYQAGNLTGALGGLQLLVGEISRGWLLLPAGAVATALWFGTTGDLGRWLALVVAGMGLLFLFSALSILFLEDISPAGWSGLDASLIVGLVGTTIVPYNFFLAAGLGSGGRLEDMRRGLKLSYLIGAVITCGIVVTGSVLISFTGFDDAAGVLDARLGGYGRWMLGPGLFAAGISSALTAPLAAAMAGREMLSTGATGQWAGGGRWFRSLWIGVLLVGLGVGLLRLPIVRVILVAQVINGVLVPLIGVLVLVLANDRRLLGEHVNGWWQNGAGLALVLFLAYRNAQLLGEAAGAIFPNGFTSGG